LVLKKKQTNKHKNKTKQNNKIKKNQQKSDTLHEELSMFYPVDSDM